METILITGGTGLVGKALTTHLLEKGYRVIILTRNKTKASVSIAASSTLNYSYWDPSLNQIDPAILQIADHIINLAGAGVADKRWSVSRKKRNQRQSSEGRSLYSSCITATSTSR